VYIPVRENWQEASSGPDRSGGADLRARPLHRQDAAVSAGSGGNWMDLVVVLGW
jgi:hypothetical protein